ncbi:MAG TPA: DUF5343 domain-containing protein [Polyangiaceae bacterium]|jgi:hypothetical protein|nr:DUF5343 domain-containing protein [Polyangiaceae bacterium]
MLDRYMTSTKNLAAIMQRIVEGAAPPKFGSGHLKRMGFKSSNDQGVVGVLRGLEFVDDSGAPTARYHAYRDRVRSRAVLGQALREAYPEIFQLNETPSQADRAEIVGLIRSTLNAEDRRAGMIAMTFFALLALADVAPGSAAGTPIGTTTRGPALPSSSDREPSLVNHTFQLRRDLTLQLAFPRDLSQGDVSRLHRWLQTLPLEDEPSE